MKKVRPGTKKKRRSCVTQLRLENFTETSGCSAHPQRRKRYGYPARSIWNHAIFSGGSQNHWCLDYPIPSIGLVNLPTWMVDFCGFHVGKYTVRPMDPSWVCFILHSQVAFCRITSRAAQPRSIFASEGWTMHLCVDGYKNGYITYIY